MLSPDVAYLIGRRVQCSDTLAHYLEYLRLEMEYDNVLLLLTKDQPSSIESIIKYNYTDLFCVLLHHGLIGNDIYYINICVNYKNTDILRTILTQQRDNEHMSLFIKPLCDIIEHYLYNVLLPPLVYHIDARPIIKRIAQRRWSLTRHILSYYLFQYITMDDDMLCESHKIGNDFSCLIYECLYSARRKQHIADGSKTTIIKYLGITSAITHSTLAHYRNDNIVYFFLSHLGTAAIQDFIMNFVHHVFKNTYLRVSKKISRMRVHPHQHIFTDCFLPDIDVPISYIHTIIKHVNTARINSL